MGQLTDEDYKYFDDYLAVHQAPIKDSEDKDAPTTKEIQATIKRIQNPKMGATQRYWLSHLDQITLETQDTSSALSIISAVRVNLYTSGIPNEHGGWPETRNTIGQALRELCSHI
ncbi:hypothetical protein O181_005810 [Austropuccinia psidii MF-1]|uniref:Uncharacterized protein n=1 Tax=Austropuccinia psidii MF-1 TaxID=1389203 RepID=A0A9Q3BJQ1_9BASI|nr:hypothetical protein [Austropuccinia psidii MF-1]